MTIITPTTAEESLLIAFLFLLTLSRLVYAVDGAEWCPAKSGGGVCPDGNTCCTSGCISSNMGSLNATCCDDGRTGCPKGYICVDHGRCLATESRTPDPLLRVLPRYALCPRSELARYKVYGLPMMVPDNSNDDTTALLPYYSSHGSLTHDDTHKTDAVELAVVVVHGGARNADDYYCPLLAARALQRQYNKTELIMVVAPRFLTASDEVEINNMHTAGNDDSPDILRFGGTGHGTWRYGAAAKGHGDFTSFDAMDRLVGTLMRPDKFANLRHIVVLGHSVGGQFTQRWSLLTSLEWNGRPSLSSVIANPSSWTYLTPQRKINGKWQVPPSDMACLAYNDWTWGLEHNSNHTGFRSPYKDRVMAHLGGIPHLVEQFRQRQVIYLAGGLDRCNVTGVGQWCQSHDLGMSCADELQGHSRWDRHWRYMESLRIMGFDSTNSGHKSRVVEGVGHDHALMFTSPEGQSEIFPLVESSQDQAKEMNLASHTTPLLLRGRARSSVLDPLVRLAKVFLNGRMALTQSFANLFV